MKKQEWTVECRPQFFKKYKAYKVNQIKYNFMINAQI